MNAKAIIPLVAGLGIGGLALKVGFDTLKRAQGAQGSVAKVQLWAAKQDIPRGTRITAELLTPLAFPTTLAPKGACKDKDALVGRVPRIDAPAGLPVLEDMLLPPGASAGINPGPGYRAVAVKIDEGSGVDYHLEPGCFVDVVGSFNARRDGRNELLARTIIENVEVAAVGPRISTAAGGASGKDAEKESARTVRAVTLLVKPEQVPALLLTEQRGKIKLSLRGNQDGSELGRSRAVSELELTGDEPQPKAPSDSLLEQLRGMLGKPQPASQPVVAAALPPPNPLFQPWDVVIFRGNQTERVRFKSRDSRERVEDQEGAQTKSGGSSLFKPGRGWTPPTGGVEPQTPKTEPVPSGEPEETQAEPQEPQE